MPLGLIPKVLNSVDVVLPVNESLRMVDPDVVEFGDIQGIVAVQAVGVHDAIRLDHLLHDRHERRGADVGYHHREHLSATLKQAENRYFPSGTSPTLAFANTAEIALVDFHLTAKGEAFSICWAMSLRSLVKKEAAVLR